MRDKNDNIIYVGKAVSLKRRVTSYFRKTNKTERIKKMVSLIDHFEYIVVDNEAEALILECNLIKKNRPKFNVLLKDDKTYPYIKIDVKSDYPNVLITRRIVNDGSKYFGPYANPGAAKEMVNFIKQKYKIRQCKNFKSTTRACLNYYIKRCLAPCTGLVSKEEYRMQINEIIDLLDGKIDKIIKDLNKQMEEASKNMEYEKAAQIRDRIQAIIRVSEKQKVSNISENDIDVIGIAKSELEVCVEIFFVRGSKMVGREHYFYNNLEDMEDEEILSGFIKQYYLDNPNIPHKIMLREELEEKQAREGKNFSSEDKTKLRNLRNVIAFSDVVEKIEEKQKNGKFEKSGLLESFSDSDFGKEFFALDSSDGAKCKAVYGYVHTLPKDQKTPDKLANLFNELREKDPELAVKVQQYVLGNSSIAEQSEFVKSDNKLAQAVVSSSINAIHTSVAIEKARKDKAMQAEDPETAEALAVLRINSSDEDHKLATSKIDASFGNVNVEKAHVDVAHNKDVVSAKAQLEMLNDTFDLGGIEAQKYAGVTNDQSYKENQLPLHNKAIQNKEVNDAMVEAGTYSRYASENQVSALTAHKQRYEQDDYTEKEAIAGLNKLSDYIADCSKDNQLAMHNEMMTSKYSEVQEHTARNIKNYDLTVQADALSTVYKSGNEKAIATAVNEVLPAIKSPDAQQIALKQAVMELAGISDNSDLQTKFANGTLTKAEIAQLSSTERRDYYVRLFDNATPMEKIEYLKSLPSGKSRQTVYNLIGTYYKNTFKTLVESDVTTAEAMYNMGLKTDLQNIVEATILFKAETNPSFKFLRDRLHLGGENDLASAETEPVTAKTINNFSIPKDFDTKELFKKDKNGIILA